ncbi:hypothetical protein N8642_04100, partial [bacterium]|nr:hypothetical protein [bacterium]
MNCLTQEAFPAPDPFTQSANQLIQTASGTSSRIKDFHSEFDSLGNRLVPLSGASFIAPVSFETEYSTEGLGNDLGSQYAMRHTPILAINGNPYALKPSIDVLQQLGPFDVQKPTITSGLQHDSSLVTQVSSAPVSAVSQILSGDLFMQTATERTDRFTSTFGYRPSIIRFFEYPDLNTIDHRSFIQMKLALQRMEISYAGRLSIATRPGAFTGARTQSTDLLQNFQISYDLNPKLDFTLNAQLNSSEQKQSIVEGLGGVSPGGAKTEVDPDVR